MWSIRLLGGASIEGPDGALSGPATHRHRLALLAQLATAHPRGVSRERLAAMLWPETNPISARNLLNQALYVLRRTLGGAAVHTTGDQVHLDPAVVPCDVVAFEDALRRGDCGAAAAAYAGPFMDGFVLPGAREFAHWLDGERERLHQACGHALGEMARAAEAGGDRSDAVAWWRALAAHDPYDSRAALRLMQALEASGNRAGALQHAATHTRRIQEEFGASPGPEVTALAERLRGEPVPGVVRPRDEAAEQRVVPRPASEIEAGDASEPAGARLARPPAPAPLPSEGGASGRRRWAAAGLLATVTIAAVIAGTLWPRGDEPEPSIVVLPFVNMSPDPDNEYFSDGLTEEITTRLSAVAQLKVISRTSAMHYQGTEKPLRQIAEELGVAHVLEGSVRQSEGRLRITAQLIDARNDQHLWAENYDHEPRDIFRVQEQIAREVVRALEVRLGARERRQLARQGTRDPEAYELYRRGHNHWRTRTREGHERAIEYFQQAIARDSTYADAYAALAGVYVTAHLYNASDLSEAETYSRMKWAAERALALDDESASAHTSFASVLWWQRNWPGAEREFRRAIELNPGHTPGWYVVLLAGMGRLGEALREARRAADLNPFVPTALANHAWLCYLARDYDCSIEQDRLILEIEPSFFQSYQRLGLVYAGRGRTEESLRALRRAVELNPAVLADLAYGLAMAGQRQEALETLERAKEMPYEPFFVGRAYVALGEPDSAFAWLERSGWQWPHRANRFDPALDPLRSDPRFARLVARVDREMGIR